MNPHLLTLTLNTSTATLAAPAGFSAAVALRSALGWSLRRQVCATGAPHCEGCALRTKCLYGRVFDPLPPERPIHPSLTSGIPGYALRAVSDAETDALQFELVVLAPQPLDVPMLAAALVGAVNGNRQFLEGRARVTQITEQALASPLPLPEPPSLEDDQAQQPAQFELRCLTPLAVKQDNVELTSGEALRAETLWRLAWRRLTQYAQLIGATMPDPAPWRAAALRLSADASALRLWRTARTSKTQQGRVHPIAGLLGSIRVRGPARDVAVLHALLSKAAPLQLGKDTVFGCGAVELGSIHAAS
ncbi:MAG: hypothetical protein NZ533_11515 [Casimicrobiaceae bacterium]|nr:hypothetical protein [Casimicrobiaceae bacterium]